MFLRKQIIFKRKYIAIVFFVVKLLQVRVIKEPGGGDGNIISSTE